MRLPLRIRVSIVPIISALGFSAAMLPAQADLWSHVSADGRPQRLQPATLTDVQSKSVAVLIRKQAPGAIWECAGPDLDGLIKGLRFEAIPMADKRELVLAEAPAGCARGGQGANGAMWVIRFEGDMATLLGTPKACSGWLFAVLPAMSHAYPDIVTGWHMSSREAGLTYLRFDGTNYRSIGAAKLEFDDNGNGKIVKTRR